MLPYLNFPVSAPIREILPVLRRLTFAVPLVACAGGASAGNEIEIVTRDRSIPVLEHRSLIEPHPAVSPTDPRHVVIGAIAATPAGREEEWTCVVLTTLDEGGSWGVTDLEIERCIDPWIVFDGSAVVATGVALGSEGSPDFRLLARRSEDGGVTWVDSSTDLGEPHDHPIIVSAGSGELLMASRRDRISTSGRPRHNLFVGKSSDGGRTMATLAEITTSNLAQNATGLARLDAATVVVTYLDFQRDVDGFGRAGMLDRGRAWAVRSDDGGRSFSEPLLVSDECASGGLNGVFPGYPFMTAAPEGSRYAGRLFHACIRPGMDGVHVNYSTDRGERWSRPLRVSTDVPRSMARTPMIAANRDGVVGVAWYDAGHDPSMACQHVYFAASTDGGETFLPSVQVSETESCPRAGGNGWIAESWPMGGDYNSLVARPDGTFLLVWADSREGIFGLRFAVTRVTGGA